MNYRAPVKKKQWERNSNGLCNQQSPKHNLELSVAWGLLCVSDKIFIHVPGSLSLPHRHSTSFAPVFVLTLAEANIAIKHPSQSDPGASSWLVIPLNTLTNNSLLKKKVIAALCFASLYPKHASCCHAAFPTLVKCYTNCSVKGFPGMKNYNPNTCWLGEKPYSLLFSFQIFSVTKLVTLPSQCHTLDIPRPADLHCFWLLFKHFWRFWASSMWYFAVTENNFSMNDDPGVQWDTEEFWVFFSGTNTQNSNDYCSILQINIGKPGL